jgi:hypothetical protein
MTFIGAAKEPDANEIEEQKEKHHLLPHFNKTAKAIPSSLVLAG